MDRMKLACLCLTASAFVLAGLLVTRMPNLVPKAQAAMIEDKSRFTMLTAQAKAGDEVLFVIDQLNEALLIYIIDPAAGRGGKQVLDKKLNLDQLFGAQAGAAPGGGGGPGRLHP